MNSKDVIELVNNLLEQHRVVIGERPEITPVLWKGISMTVDEAKLIIHELETAKVEHQKALNNTQTGGEITKLAAGGTGIVAMVTGGALMLFPPTALAGIVTLLAGLGTTSIGQAVGEGVKEIGTISNLQVIQQIDAYIDSIKNAIIASI